MKLFNVMTKEEFAIKGELKRLWHKVGIIRLAKQGNAFLHLFQQPTTTFYLFESDKAKDQELPTIPFDESEGLEEEMSEEKGEEE